MLVGTCTCQPKAEDVDYMFEETGKLDNLGMGRHFAGLLAVQVLWGGGATNFAANFILQPMIATINYTMWVLKRSLGYWYRECREWVGQ